MRRKLLTIVIFAITFFALSCSQKKVGPPFYILSPLPHIQQREMVDHKFCSSIKFDLKNSDLRENKSYWRCRLTVAKQRLAAYNTPSTRQYNLEISDLITKISLKISASNEESITRQNIKIDDRQHRQCLKLGYEIATKDQAKIDEYFACRLSLLDDMQHIPPYGNLEYSKYKNSEYNINFVVNKRIDANIAQYEEQKKQYPDCVKFNLYEKNFANCTKAYDNFRACSKEVPKKSFKKEVSEKIKCQRRSYVRFPNELIKQEENVKDNVAQRNYRSDLSNQNNLESLGLDAESFAAPIFEEEIDFDSLSDEEIDEIMLKEDEERRIAQEQKEKDINSKKGLYSKFEVNKLRQQYVVACKKEADKIVEQFTRSLKQDCMDMKNFKVLGEEEIADR